MIQELAERQACCDNEVVSAAGREFCYVDVIHPEGTFDECDLPDYKEMFTCCDRVANGDLSTLHASSSRNYWKAEIRK